MMQNIELLQVLMKIAAFMQLEYDLDKDWKLYKYNTKLQLENCEVLLATKNWFFQCNGTIS